MNIFEKICSITESVINVDKNSLSRETLLTEIDCDSLDVVEILMAIEDEFDTEISDEAADSFRTIGDIEAYLDSIR